jgi:NifU-like protein involved in Fe-S cluster formation
MDKDQDLDKFAKLNQALACVSVNEILKQLGGLPEAAVHCAQLATETLRRALADYLYKKPIPWKKHYQKS